VHLISLKSCFDVCQVTVLSKLDFKKRVCKSIDFQKKKEYALPEFEPANPERKSAALPIELYGCVFDGMLLEFSPLLHLQPAAERNLITASTCGNKLEG